jgi:hypothetical protein
MLSLRHRIARRWGWLGLLVVLAGCGPGKTEVSGTVRYKGEPLTSGDVLVIDADGMPHTSPISDHGSYAARGVPVGPVRFAVQVLDKRDKDGKPLLPARYAAVGTSGLSTTLKRAPNTFDLELE